MDESLYQTYLLHLMNGESAACSDIIKDLLAADTDIRTLYIDLFQRSLYEIGALWETNRISVSREHLATAITDRLMNLVYPKLFSMKRTAKRGKAIVACPCNELHQIGGKMAADMLELHGFDTHFLGGNLPGAQLVRHVRETGVDLVGLSVSVYFNLPGMTEVVERILAQTPNVQILVGGQAFCWGGAEAIDRFPRTVYLPSLAALEDFLKRTI